jgi:subtilisin family serine protease
MDYISFSSKTLLSLLIVLFFKGFTGSTLQAQERSQSPNNYKVVRGERPPIDFSSLNTNAYEEGVLLIKFRAEYSDFLEQNPVLIPEDGSVRFNIATVDNLNNMYQARDVEQSFLHPSLNNSFTEKHKTWGFHLWYRLEFDENADMIAIAQDYGALGEVEIAEPEFKKHLIEGMNMELLTEITKPNHNPALEWMPDDPSFSNQWHYYNTGQQNGTPGADIDLILAWDIEKGNTNVIVAIVDDGIQYTHPDIAGNMWADIGYNFVAGNSNVVPGNHGTHVAGTVAAVTNNAVGVAGIAGGSGIDDGVRLMSAQVFQGNSSGGFHIAPVWAADNGAAISQNSWGYTTPGAFNQNVLDAIDYFNINGGGNALIDGGITIFAAGNDNSSANYYPGFYSGTLAVAATNNQDAKSWYSNYGSWIDISAPGGETNSVNARGVLSTVTNNNYAYYQGTSMACPHVSGVAALVLSLAYGELSPDDLRDILLYSTDDHYPSNPNFVDQLGTGRLNAYQALLETQSYLTGVMNPMGFTASAEGPNSIALSWNRNADNHDVMVAWSDNSIIGVPDSAMIYQVGDTIPGGGLVLYSGPETSYEHTGLESATMYYYKAWSYNDTLVYSSGRPASATTTCELFELPVNEGFEDITVIPICWSQEFASGGASWKIGTGNGGSNPPNAFEGSFNAYFKEQDIGSSGLTTRLVLPEMNLAPYDSVQLTFHYTNQLRTFWIFNWQDILRIKYKPTANAEWETLATYNTNIANWTEVTLTLPAQSGTYFLAFEAQSGMGHGVCIDDIAILGYGSVNTFNISAAAGPNGSIMPYGNIMVQEGSDITFEITADPGYTIDSLEVDNTLIEEATGLQDYSYTFTNILQDHQISASFFTPEYEVTANVFPVDAGTIEGTGTFPMNFPVHMFAFPSEGFTFDRWMEGENVISYENPYVFNITGNRELIAVFEISVYSVDVEVNPENAGVIIGEGDYLHAAEVTLLATANHGYEFSGWSEDGEIVSSDNPYIFNAFNDRNLVAGFDPLAWNISVLSDPEGAGTIEGAGEYFHGTTVELTASANWDYTFIHWLEGDEIVSTDNPYQFVADNHKSLTARFDFNTGIGLTDAGYLKLYPNPSSGLFTLELDERAAYRVIDLTGRVIAKHEATPGKVLLDLSKHSAGLYFLQIYRQSETLTLKLIVE